jgi:hypothetical protein
VLQALIDLEATQVIGAARDERTDTRSTAPQRQPDREAASRPSASATANDSQHVRKPCSIGCPVPRSDQGQPDGDVCNRSRRPSASDGHTLPGLGRPCGRRRGSLHGLSVHARREQHEIVYR